MATEKQIAANRRNGRCSTGPRTGAGKKRASQNSYRHGLATGMTSNAEHAEYIERLSRTIAGNTDVAVLECARTIAHALFDLAQIQRVKAASISRDIELSRHEASTTKSECSMEALQRVLAALIKLDRYERRAWVRRDRAVVKLSGFKKANDTFKL
jgi:hypothetical protein